MSRRSAQILEDVLSLPTAERIALVEQVLASLDCLTREDIDRLWGKECEDRIEAFERGEIPTVPAKDVFGNVRES